MAPMMSNRYTILAAQEAYHGGSTLIVSFVVALFHLPSLLAARTRKR